MLTFLIALWVPNFKFVAPNLNYETHRATMKVMCACAPTAGEVGAAGEVEGTQGDKAAERAQRAVTQAVTVAQVEAGQP